MCESQGTQHKIELLKLLVASCLEEEKSLERGRAQAVDAALNAPPRMESRYDSTKEEMSRLADGFGEKLLEILNLRRGIEGQLAVLRSGVMADTSAVARGGSLVILKLPDDSRRAYFIVNGGAGRTFTVGGQAVTLISPGTPIGGTIIGRVPGGSVPLRIGGTTVEAIVESIE